MARNLLQSRPAILVCGLVLGLVIGLQIKGLWPQIPLHAVATHGQENFAIATGFVDDQTEAIYFLDFVTGDLRAAVLQPRTGKFNSFFTGNVLADFGGAALKTPRFLMVTGLVDIPRGAQNFQFARSAVYIAEATTGQVACYAIPWNAARQAQGAAQSGNFVPLDKQQFRNPMLIRD